MAYGYYLEAEYQDGHIVREDEADQSDYEPGRNKYYDIVQKRPEADHGPMVRFSIIGLIPDADGNTQRYDIDWRTVDPNTRPIFYREMIATKNTETGEEQTYCTKQVFGYQWTDQDGKNQQEVVEIQ